MADDTAIAAPTTADPAPVTTPPPDGPAAAALQRQQAAAQPAAPPAVTQPAIPSDAALAARAAPASAAPTPAAAPAAQGQQAVPTTQAGAPQTPAKPLIDPRAYQLVAENNPQAKNWIDAASERTGASRERLAMHWLVENSFKPDAPDNQYGAGGAMQITPGAQHEVDPRGLLDKHNPEDALILAGRYINQLDGQFGKDTPSSVMGYFAGPRNTSDIVNLMKTDPQTAQARNPKSFDYVNKFYGGQNPAIDQYNAGHNMTAPGIVQAANQGGPDGALKYITSTMPPEVGLTDGMRMAEATLVSNRIARGDYVGAQHARDFFFQLSYTGTNQYLMAAHQALVNNDPVGASQALAKAHAFFPDGTAGQFGTDRAGNVWGYRMDEHNPSRQLGPPFKVTADGVAAMLNKTLDPHQYLTTVMEQQKNAAYIRYHDELGAYHAGMLAEKPEIAAAHDTTKITVEQMREAARQGNGPSSKLSSAADKETASEFTPDNPTYKGLSAGQLGDLGEVYHEARMGGVSPPQARAVALGVKDGSLQFQRQTDGSFGVVSKDQPGHPIAYLSKSLVERLAGSKMPNAPQSQPIGAGASTPYARGAGIDNNLTGTVMPQQAPPAGQSSAIPTNPGAAPPGP